MKALAEFFEDIGTLYIEHPVTMGTITLALILFVATIILLIRS